MTALLVASLAVLGAAGGTETATAAPSAAAEEVEAKSWLDDWVLLPIVFYTPETRLGFGGMVVYTFDGPGGGGEYRRSNLLFRAFYTLEKQTSLYLEPNVWMLEDRLAVTGWLEWRNYPFHYYGVGNEPDLDDFDVYTEVVFETTPRVTWRLSGDLRGGLNLHLIGGNVKDYPRDGLLVRDDARGLGPSLTWGFGPSLSWDSRDSNFWPSSGSLLNVDLTIFEEALGSDFSFLRFTADLRGYTTLWAGHVLAMQGLLQLTDGDPPFTLLPRLGGTRAHRGWYNGSLRDQHVYLAQLEYRAPLWWRFGATAFVSAGQALPELDAVNLGALTYAVGGGVRFRLNDEGVNVRIDFAYGGQFEFYFQVGEAF